MLQETGEKISKEVIKSRMLRVAANLWGYADTLSESSFDPLVGIMFEALASEIEQVYNEVKMSESRVMERLAQSLLPDVVTAPQPAHTIVHAVPTENRYTFKRNQHLFYKKPIQSQFSSDRDRTKNIFFTPVDDVALFKGGVRMMATPYQIFKANNALNKEPVAINSQGRTENAPLSLWLGIEISPLVKDLKGLSFFFENKNDTEKARFYDLLEMCNATCCGQKLDLRRKIHSSNDASPITWNPNTDVTSILENRVADLYAPCFLHVADSCSIKESDFEMFPAELQNYYSPAQLAAFKNKLLWVKITFPSGLINKIVADIHVSINCFPVINRQLLEFSYRLQDALSIIPLSTEDTYLDMVKIYSADRMEYKLLQPGTGGYVVRQGAVGRFDARNANELLAYMLNLLQDESSAFSSMGIDILQNNIKQLAQLINALQQRINLDSRRKDTTTYVMVQPQQGFENIYIEYWVTQGTEASGIRQGTGLQLYTGSGLVSESVYTMRNTSEAEEKFSATKSIHAFKSALLSRGRIGTEQDIRFACFAELGTSLERLEIKTSFLKSHDKGQGFQKIIAVELVPALAASESMDWDYACSKLELKLRQQSIQIIPIHVSLKQN